VPTYLDEALAKLEQFEGSVAWMYRDTVGKVTVGVGMLLPDADAACRLPFLLLDEPASESEIRAEFARVDSLPMGRPSLFYRSTHGPELEKNAIDSMLRQVVQGFEAELGASLPGWESFPDGVKLALLDMAYNLGPRGLLQGYPRLMHAVRTGAWVQAAAECYRKGPGAARNEWTRQMFLSSVVGSVKANAESSLARFGFGLIGMGASAAAWLTQRARRRR
jgi:GH24 family phage-related lysozyme (muramidase)